MLISLRARPQSHFPGEKKTATEFAEQVGANKVSLAQANKFLERCKAVASTPLPVGKSPSADVGIALGLGESASAALGTEAKRAVSSALAAAAVDDMSGAQLALHAVSEIACNSSHAYVLLDSCRF